MRYTRCGMPAASGRRFDESYGNNGNYEIYEISAPPKLAVRVKTARSQYPWVKYRGAPFTHYSHNSHNSHYSHFMRRPHELSGMTGYTKLALQYRQGMTAFPPPPAGQGGVMMLVRNRPPPPRGVRPDRLYKTCAAVPVSKGGISEDSILQTYRNHCHFWHFPAISLQ